MCYVLEQLNNTKQNKNKAFIPPSLKHEYMKGKQLYSNNFAFTFRNSSMMVTYTSKRNKYATVLSSMHFL